MLMKNVLNAKSAVILIGTISALAVGGYIIGRYIKAKIHCCMESETDLDISDILVKPLFDCKFSAMSRNDVSAPSHPHSDLEEAAEPSIDPAPAETSTVQTNLPTSPVDMDSDLYNTIPREEDKTD
jgi:hypothetical protein